MIARTTLSPPSPSRTAPIAVRMDMPSRHAARIATRANAAACTPGPNMARAVAGIARIGAHLQPRLHRLHPGRLLRAPLHAHSTLARPKTTNPSRTPMRPATPMATRLLLTRLGRTTRPTRSTERILFFMTPRRRRSARLSRMCASRDVLRVLS